MLECAIEMKLGAWFTEKFLTLDVVYTAKKKSAKIIN